MNLAEFANPNKLLFKPPPPNLLSLVKEKFEPYWD
jgi:hypothetical protein